MLSFQAELSIDQLYQLIAQLPKAEKISLSKKLRAEFASAEWLKLSESLPDVPEINMDEIVAEVKSVRELRS